MKTLEEFNEVLEEVKKYYIDYIINNNNSLIIYIKIILFNISKKNGRLSLLY